MKAVSTVIATILMLMITIALASMAYVYISGIFTTSTLGLELEDAYCVGTTATWVIKNNGAIDIAASSLTLTSITEACTTDPVVAVMPAGQTITLTATTCTTGRAHTFRLRGPSNAIQLSVQCA